MAAVAMSSRRFACDRCRGRKLRCLRETGDPERCDRCMRADTECLTTPSSSTTARSQSTDLSLPTPRKRRHRGPSPAPPATFADIALAPGDPGGPGAWPHIWDASIHNMDFGNGLENIILPSLDHHPINTCAPVGAHVLPPSQPISPFGVTPKGAQETPSNQDVGKSSSSSSEAFGFSLDGVLNSRSSQTPLPGNDSSATYFHRLSSTNLLLMSQLSRINQGPPKITLDMLISKIDESDPSSTSPVEDILSTTGEFIEVLEALSRGPVLSTTPSLSVPPSTGNASGLCQNLTSEHLNNKSTIDITTLLLILSCYVQVLRLYVILFAHIYQFLLDIAESDDPTLCPLPNMGFGTFALESGNLQATLFIQIATSLFEKMECLLGLPPELRITMRAVDRGGLSVEEDFQEVIMSVLSKDEMGKPENGKGGMASLRKNMKNSMQLLRESIAP
ncbi:hypothetical protein GGR51DRAFT_19540 [Nemania sp. FL0031]|nr:hypothetical protein GGR51DRAFT_19540 [Nemania sp. FL0031]